MLFEPFDLIHFNEAFNPAIPAMFLDAGFTDYISKPINPVEYEEKVAKYLPTEKVIYS